MEFFVERFLMGLLIFVRMLAMMIATPFFSSLVIGMRFKVILALTITIVIYPMVATRLEEPPLELVEIGFRIMYEAIIGLSIGTMVALIFSTFQLAGQFFSLQIGFGISQFFDPLQQIEASIIGQFIGLFGMLIFLNMDGHHLVIGAVYESYFAFPVMSIEELSGYFASHIVDMFSNMFLISLKIAFPVMATVFLVTLSLGILARFAPQLNIFILGFPIYIVAGLITLMLTLPPLLGLATNYLYKYIRMIVAIMTGT